MKTVFEEIYELLLFCIRQFDLLPGNIKVGLFFLGISALILYLIVTEKE
jgi:hypothetical protein